MDTVADLGANAANAAMSAFSSARATVSDTVSGATDLSKRQLTRALSMSSKAMKKTRKVIRQEPIEYKFELPDGAGESVEVIIHHDSVGQHTLIFPSAVRARGLELVPGSCNLYTYPKYLPHGLHPELDAVALEGGLLQLLGDLIIGLSSAHDRFMDTADASGALPFLALLVANTDAVLELSMRIFEERPELLPRPHIRGSPFEGEQSLHILAVNRREEELIRLLELASERLDRGQCKNLLHGRVAGAFFMSQPMEFYGATILSYCVAFSLSRAIAAMLILGLDPKSPMHGLINPNDQALACPVTGFLPIHTAVANGLTRMFDFLQELPGLPECRELRAFPEKLSMRARWGPVGRLTPLQLACYLGQHRMFQHILKRRAQVNWSWGPVTEYRVHLEGIDSLGDGDNDVMNLVARSDAMEETKQMLADEFLLGFIYKLYQTKWTNFGRTVFVATTLCDLLYVGTLAALAISQKMLPRFISDGDTSEWRWERIGPVVCLCSMVPTMCTDAFCTVQYYRSVKSSKILWKWLKTYQVHTKWLALFLTIGACVFLITRPDCSRGECKETYDRDQMLAPVWFFLAMPLLLAVQRFAQALVDPIQKIGTLYIITFKMLFSDVTRFMIIFAIFLLNYGLAMYLTVPPFVMDNTDDNSEGRWTLIAMLQDLVKLGLLGVELPMDFRVQLGDFDTQGGFDKFNGPYLGGWGCWNLGWFLVMYIFYLLMSIILLLNLLIAMMGQTYEKTMEVSEIEWRVAFARRILLYETLAAAYNACRPKSKQFTLRAGKYWPDGKHYHIFRDVTANLEGSGTGGIIPLFRQSQEDTAPPEPPVLPVSTPSPEHGELKGAATPLLAATPAPGKKGGLAPLPAGVSAVPDSTAAAAGEALLVSPSSEGPRTSKLLQRVNQLAPIYITT